MKIKKPEMYGAPRSADITRRAGPYDVKDRGVMTLGRDTGPNAKNASPISMEAEGGMACSRQNKSY